MDNVALIIKFLKKKKWVYDGTEYIFRNPRIIASNLRSEVDVILPVKGQSYTRLKFSDSVQQIVNETFDMFDINRHLSFEIEYYVDGKVAKDVYLNDETKLRIRSKLKELTQYKRKHPNISFNVDVFPAFQRKPTVSGEDVTFPFFWDISKIKLEGVPVKVKPEYLNQAKSYLTNLMLEDDFSSDVSDLFYLACEPDFQLVTTSDLYISVSGFLRNIDGVNVGDTDWSYPDYSPDFFEKID